MIQVTDAIALKDSEVDERFVRAIGPGGQNVRKEATAVEIRFDVGASTLAPDVKDRLIALGGRAVTSGGVLVIVSRARRSQADNRKTARARLIALVKRAASPPARRRPTRPRKAVRDERLALKHRRAAVKQARSGRGDD